MKKPIKDAVDYLIKSYKSVQDEARGWVLNIDDIESALKEVKPDTAEYNVLMLLAQTNFVEVITTATPEEFVAPMLPTDPPLEVTPQ